MLRSTGSSSPRIFAAGAHCVVAAITQIPAQGEGRSAMWSRSGTVLRKQEDRAIPGHWEGDLLAGSNRSFIATLVERKSRFVMLVKVPSSETQVVVGALTRRIRKLPKPLRRSLTRDRGKEMSSHKDFSLATDVKIYFCDPSEPLAARLEREHQRTVAPVLSQRNRSVELLTVVPRQNCSETEPAPSRDIGISNPSR